MSCEQSTIVEPLAHRFDADVHSGSGLQLHPADPGLPIQLWRGPGHATAVPYDQQPSIPSAHVARPPEIPHSVCPCEQLLSHVSEHAASGDLPEHDSGPGHVVEDSTYGQLSSSTAHATSVCASSHVVPAPVQIDGVHVHSAALPEPMHV